MSAPQQQPQQEIPLRALVIRLIVLQQETLNAIAGCQVQINSLLNSILEEVNKDNSPQQQPNQQQGDKPINLQSQPQTNQSIREQSQPA